MRVSMQSLKQRVYTLLRASEKYFKTDMVYLAKGGFWLTLGQGFVSLSAFLLAIAFANLAPKEVFGMYKYILSIGGVLGAFTLTGLGTALTRSVAQGKNEGLHHAFWTQLRWSLWITVFSFAGSLYYALNENIILSVGLIITGVFSPLSQSAALYLSFLSGKKDFQRKATYDIFYNLIPVVSIFITMLLTTNPIILVLSYFVSYAFSAFLFFGLTTSKYPESKKGELPTETINYGKHLSIVNLLNIAAAQIDKILIFHYLGPVQLAIYAFALSPASQLMTFLRTINVLSFPKFSNKNKELIQQTLPEKLSRLSIPLVVIVLTYITMAPFVYKVLFPQYLDSVFYSQLYALTLLFFPQEFMRTAIIAHSKEGILYANTIILLATRVICLFIFVPLFGITGAIAGILLSSIVTQFTTKYFFKKM